MDDQQPFPDPYLRVTAEDRRLLEAWATSRTEPVRVVARSRIVLSLADGVNPTDTARRLGTTRATVRLWRDRYLAFGPQGLLHDKPGRGRRPAVDPAVWRSIHGFNGNGNGHSPNNRQLAEALGISMATVARWRRRLQSEHAQG